VQGDDPIDEEIDGILELSQQFAMFGSHFKIDDRTKRTVWHISSLDESKISKEFNKNNT
jgi:hypothetical protein